MDALERVRQMMDERHWTEYRLAKETGLPLSTITNMFRRQNAPTIPTLEMICQGFGITLSQFFARQSNMVELTQEQMAMFQRWATLTKEQKTLIAQLIDNMK